MTHDTCQRKLTSLPQITLSARPVCLKTIRNLLKRPAPREQLPLPFIEEHPLIRRLSDYSVDSLNAFRKERNNERESP